MYGREARLPVDIMLGELQSTSFSSPSDFVRDLQSTLLEAYDVVRQNTQSQQARQKDLYDVKIFGAPYDLVWLHNPAIKPGCSRKLSHPWSGPYKVLERISDVTYCIQHLRNRKKRTVHFNRLKACQAPAQLPTAAPQQFGQNLELSEDFEEERSAQPSATSTQQQPSAPHRSPPPTQSTAQRQPTAPHQSPPTQPTAPRRNPPRSRHPPNWYMLTQNE